MVAGHVAAVVERARCSVLPGQLAPYPARWNLLIEQHVRSGRVDLEGALKFSPLGAVPGEQQLIVRVQHRLAVECQDRFAATDQQQGHYQEPPFPILRAPKEVTERHLAVAEPAAESRRLLRL